MLNWSALLPLHEHLIFEGQQFIFGGRDWKHGLNFLPYFACYPSPWDSFAAHLVLVRGSWFLALAHGILCRYHPLALIRKGSLLLKLSIAKGQVLWRWQVQWSMVIQLCGHCRHCPWCCWCCWCHRFSIAMLGQTLSWAFCDRNLGFLD